MKNDYDDDDDDNIINNKLSLYGPLILYASGSAGHVQTTTAAHFS
jgi:hypothetical protein